MFISVTRNKFVPYLLLALLCALFTEVYALFGHGVRSRAMDWMALVPLAGGMLVALLRPQRLVRNVWNAGLATGTAGMLFQGILEIAGADSVYTVAFYAVGGALAGLGLLLWMIEKMHKSG